MPARFQPPFEPRFEPRFEHCGEALRYARAMTDTRHESPSPRTHTAPAIFRPPRRGEARSAVVSDFLGFRLTSLGATSLESRVSGATLLVSRLGQVEAALPGASRAVELRYITWPASATPDGEERAACFVLARVSRGLGAAGLRDEAKEYAEALRSLLASTLRCYRFAPLTQRDEVAWALSPFAVRDTVEIRRRMVDSPHSGRGPLPLEGLPDADELVEMMLGQDAPIAVSICVSPVPGGSSLFTESVVPTESTVPEATARAVVRREQGGSPSIETLTQRFEDLAAQQWYVERLASVRQRPFHLRVQAASTGRLRDDFLLSLSGEIGGPGRFTAKVAWQTPSHPVAGGARCVRPRSSARISHDEAAAALARRSDGATPPAPGSESESSIAARNFARLGFAPWGSDTLPGPEAGITALSDLGEVSRLLALPLTAQWLPAQGPALPLPFRAGQMEGLRLGMTHVRGVARPVFLPLASRAHHLWVVGQTGTGKSTLIESLVLQDVRADRAVFLVDPHGDLIEQVLGKIPARREKDVILFDPADTAFPLGLNPLQARTEAEQAQVVSTFIGLLRKLCDPLAQGIVGPRLEHAARNGLLTVMSAPRGGTLLDFIRVFTDDRFRRELLPYVRDPLVRRYWTDQIVHASELHRSEVLDYVVSTFSAFVTDYTLRSILGQHENSFSFREAMDSGKIVLMSLAKGRLGSTTATFLGLILLPMILQAALSRVQLAAEARRDVALYVDEFQNYATDSLALMLAESRKYHLALTLANQHVGQLTHEIRDAVIGNVGSILALRLGVADAAAMEQMLAPSPVQASHLTGLPNYAAYGRVLVAGRRTPAFALETEPVTARYSAERAARIREHSRRKYGRAREQVAKIIAERANL